MIKIAVIEKKKSWEGNYRVRIYDADISEIMEVKWTKSHPDSLEEVIKRDPVLDKTFNVNDMEGNDTAIILDRLDVYNVTLYFTYDKLTPTSRAPLKVKLIEDVDVKRVALFVRREGDPVAYIGNLSISVEMIKGILSSRLPPGWVYDLNNHHKTQRFLPNTGHQPIYELIEVLAKLTFKSDPEGILLLGTDDYEGAHLYHPLKPSGRI